MTIFCIYQPIFLKLLHVMSIQRRFTLTGITAAEFFYSSDELPGA